VRISRKISVYGAKGKIDDRVRIDDDVVIKGKISFGQRGQTTCRDGVAVFS